MYAWILVLSIVLALGLLMMAQQLKEEVNNYADEGFTTIDLATATAQRQGLQFEGEGRYNDFARLQGSQVTLSADQVDAALQQAIPVPTSHTSSLMSLLASTDLGAAAPPGGASGVEQTGTVQQKINFCESLTTVNCDLLQDPRLAECGICHRDGVNSKGRPHRGGMYIASEAQIRANEAAGPKGKATYQPTVGTCKPQNFTVMTETCRATELHMQCQKAGAATSANQCGQCFGSAPPGSTGLLYVGPKPRTYTAVLHVSHPGMHSASGAGLVVELSNGARYTLSYSNQPLLDPQQLTMEITEGSTFTVSIFGIPPIWCAWFSSPDGKRSVSLDLCEQSIQPAGSVEIAGNKNSLYITNMLANNAAWPAFRNQVPNTVLWYSRRDEVTPGGIVSAWYGTTVRGSPNARGVDVTDFLKIAAGSGRDQVATNQTFNNDPAQGIAKHLWINLDNGNTIIIPENGTISNFKIANYMIMQATMPATLVDPLFADDKALCPSGPLLFTEVGAGIMAANSCFTVTGAFNPGLFCMQRLFQSAGGNSKGRRFPRNAEQAAALAVNNSLDDTINHFNNLANIAIYGVDNNGAPQRFEVVKAAALDMLGIAMVNPCDGPNAQTGPHTADCLDYLWRTSGNPSQDAVPVDPTTLPYSSCGRAGTAAPLNADGSANQNNITTANTKGAVPNIRSYYQGIFNRSQDSSNFDAQAAAMRNCFNINIIAPPETPESCPPPNPDEWQCFSESQIPPGIAPHAVPAFRYINAVQQMECATKNGRDCHFFPSTKACQDWTRNQASDPSLRGVVTHWRELTDPAAALIRGRV